MGRVYPSKGIPLLRADLAVIQVRPGLIGEGEFSGHERRVHQKAAQILVCLNFREYLITVQAGCDMNRKVQIAGTFQFQRPGKEVLFLLGHTVDSGVQGVQLLKVSPALQIGVLDIRIEVGDGAVHTADADFRGLILKACDQAKDRACRLITGSGDIERNTVTPALQVKNHCATPPIWSPCSR